MGRHGVQQRQQRPVFPFCHRIFLIKFIDQGHHGSDGGIVFQGLEISRHLLDGLVHLCLQIGAVALFRRKHILQLPHSLQESAAALYTVLAPGGA